MAATIIKEVIGLFAYELNFYASPRQFMNNAQLYQKICCFYLYLKFVANIKNLIRKYVKIRM